MLAFVATLALGWSVTTAPPLPADPCGFYYGAAGRAQCDACLAAMRAPGPDGAPLAGARALVVQRVTMRKLTPTEQRRYSAAGGSAANTTWPVSPHRLLVTHDPRSDWVATRIRRVGYWEVHSPQDVASLGESARPLPAAGTLLDVGANIGYYTLLFAHAGWRVLAVEALATNRRALETSLCLNSDVRARVTLVGAAVGNPTGEEACVVGSDSARNVGDGVMKCGPDVACAKHNPICERVPLTTLDRILAEHATTAGVDVVKMDIEGSECAAMAGGQSLFTKYRPLLLQLELKERHVDACAHEQAARHGYRIGGRRGNDNNAVLART